MKSLLLRAVGTFAIFGALVAAAPAAAAAPDEAVVSSDSHATLITSDLGDVVPARIDHVTVRVGEATTAMAGYRTTTTISILDKPSAPAAPAPMTILASGSHQNCDTDGGYVVRICITQYYNYFYSGGTRWAQVTKYTGVFTKLDSAWGWSGAVMKAGVNGRCWSGCSFLSTGTTKSIGSPVSGATYTLVPWWSSYYTQIYGTLNYRQYGWGEITVTRGGTSYRLVGDYVYA